VSAGRICDSATLTGFATAETRLSGFPTRLAAVKSSADTKAMGLATDLTRAIADGCKTVIAWIGRPSSAAAGRAEGVLLVTLHRPATANAMNTQMGVELGERAFFVGAHEPTVAGHIGSQDGWERRRSTVAREERKFRLI